MTQPEITEFLSGLGKERYRAVQVMKCKLASPEEIEKARKLCQDLFGKIGPESGEALVAHFKEQLQTWRKQLVQFRPLAHTGQYPGASAIDRALSVIEGILAIRDSFESIIAFNKKKNELPDTGDDIHELSGFYANQKPTWDKLRQSLRIFNTNAAALNKNADAAQALKRLQEIAAHDAPYGMIKDVEALIARVASINESMASHARQEALTDIETKIQTISAALDTANASDDARNRILHPIQAIKQAMSVEESIPALSYHREESGKAMEEALDAIEALKPATGETKPPKQTKVVRLASVSQKPYLESASDIEAFVEEVKKRLLAELAQDTRIRLQ